MKPQRKPISNNGLIIINVTFELEYPHIKPKLKQPIVLIRKIEKGDYIKEDY